MKNIFIIIISLVLITSCNNEEIIKNDSSNEFIQLSRGSQDIEKSSEFIHFRGTFSTYLTELNSNPNYQTEKILLANLDIQNLENVDLSGTKLYASILELESLYTTYGIFTFTSSNTVNSNNAFQNYVIEGGTLPLQLNSGTNQTNDNPCVFGCINDAVACSNIVNHAYNTQMNLASRELLRGNPFGAAVIATIARIQQGNGQSECANNLKGCYSGCEE
jgi:hypothetical protein